MVWLLLAVLVFIAMIGLGIMRAPGRRARTRLNEQGLPRPFTRAGHERNDEE